MTRVACIGECMVELKQAQKADAEPGGGGLYSRGYGGDTLNTAVYLARLGVEVDYITALGEDPMSDEMIAGWAVEGVGTQRVVRLRGKLPGLYMIETDETGERRFFHWRESSAARSLMDLPQTNEVLDALAGYDVVYLSAITLSLYTESGRTKLFAAIKRAREAGVRIVFDSNRRANGWPDPDVARAVFREAFELADIVLASLEDLLPLFPDQSNDQLLALIPAREVVLKQFEPGTILRFDGIMHQTEAEPVTAPVVDTTAAGDSFAAAYIAARLAGADPVDAARAGHHLAGAVVCHHGAIIPLTAMPEQFTLRSTASHGACS